MSSPKIPSVGVGGTADAQTGPGVEETGSFPTSAPAPVTIGEAFKNQQESVDKAATNVSSLSGGGSEPVSEDSGSFLATLSPEDRMARQLKSAAPRQPESDAAASPSPQVKDIAASKPELLPIVTPFDLAAADSAATPAGDPLAAVAAALVDAFKRFLQPIFLMNVGFVLAGNWLFNNLNMGISQRHSSRFMREEPDRQESEDRTNQPETVSVRRWVEKLMVGEQVKEIIIEQIRKSVHNVTTVERRRISHVFTPAEVSDSMRQHDIMPVDMPNQDVVSEKVAKAANEALEELAQTLQTNHFN